LKIGGKGVVVEIDESLFARVKHHRGKDLKKQQIWVFGLRERGTNKCIFRVVEDRTAPVLLDIIVKHVQPGTTIISDCWKSYNSINKKGFDHLSVNHPLNFVAPAPISTQALKVNS
jgi:hypothetical protein